MKNNVLNALPGDDPTCKRIPLTQGQAHLVSAEDFDWMTQHKRFARWNPHTKSFYALRNVYQDGKRTTLFAHREIMGIEPGDPRHVHHVNGKTLDNRRENLLVLTALEHANEHRNDPRKNASLYGIGIRRQRNGRFEAQAEVAGKRHCLGTFDTPEEAQAARKEFLKEYAA